jgi:hypothetical protein
MRIRERIGCVAIHCGGERCAIADNGPMPEQVVPPLRPREGLRRERNRSSADRWNQRVRASRSGREAQAFRHRGDRLRGRALRTHQALQLQPHREKPCVFQTLKHNSARACLPLPVDRVRCSWNSSSVSVKFLAPEHALGRFQPAPSDSSHRRMADQHRRDRCGRKGNQNCRGDGRHVKIGRPLQMRRDDPGPACLERPTRGDRMV